MNQPDAIWSVTEGLRGHYEQSDYGKVIIPFTLLRRLDSILEPNWPEIRKVFGDHRNQDEASLDGILMQVSGREFYNKSPFSLTMLLRDPDNISKNLENYVKGFSSNVREIFVRYKFSEQIIRLKKSGLLMQIVHHFVSVDLHSDTVSNIEMGRIFETLLGRIAELNNVTPFETEAVTIGHCCRL